MNCILRQIFKSIQFKEDEMGRTCGTRVLVGKSEGKRPLLGPRHQLEGNIKMALKT
jgi:hypothetical protein